MSDPYDLPIFGLPVIDSPKVFRQWSRIYNEPVSQARFAAAIGLLTNPYLKPNLLPPFLQMPQVLTSYSNSMLHLTSNMVLPFMVETGTCCTYKQDNSGYT
jgi:hypothetical protein